MSIDPASLYSSLYARAASGSAGATLRALLGSASSLFLRTKLGANKNAQTALPWLAWAPLGVSGPSGAMRDLGGSWWIYAGPDSEHLVHPIAAALDSLYGHTARYSISGAFTYVSFIGPVRPDATLGGLLGCEVRVNLTQRG